MSVRERATARGEKMKAWGRAHPILVIFALVLFCTAVPTGVALYLNNERVTEIESTVETVSDLQHRFLEYQVETKVVGCRNSNRGRKALQEVLDRAANPPPTGAAGISFAAIPGFAQLDRQTQFFLNNLEDALASLPNGTENLKKIAEDYREKNPSNVDCEAEGRKLRKELTGG